MGGRPAFFSDYDGTLDLHLPGGIRARDREAIARFRAAGGLFGIDTGRTRRRLFSKLDGKVEVDFAVLLSGAVVTDGSGSIVWERRLERETTYELVRRYRIRTLGLYVVAGNEYWTASPVALVRRSRRSFNIVRSLAEIPDPLYGVAFRALTRRGAAHLTERIAADFGPAVDVFQNVMSVDVAPPGCSKASGLELARDTFGAGMTAAIGDSYNDIPMLRAADVGYSFPSAPAEVRAAADVVVENVAQALEDFSRRAEL